jgi:hypothetical protein
MPSFCNGYNSGRRLGRPLSRQGHKPLVTHPVRLHFPDLLHYLFQIVACRVLQRREVDIGLKVLQPESLTDW